MTIGAAVIARGGVLSRAFGSNATTAIKHATLSGRIWRRRRSPDCKIAAYLNVDSADRSREGVNTYPDSSFRNFDSYSHHRRPIRSWRRWPYC